MKHYYFKFSVIILTIFISIGKTKGQINSSYERLFYTARNAEYLEYCAKFENGKVWLKRVSYNEVRNNLAKSPSYYDNEIWTDNGTEAHFIFEHGPTKEYERCFVYCPSLSTSSRYVYKRHLEYSWTHPQYGAYWAEGGIGCVNVQYLSDGGRRFFYNYDMYVAFSPDKSSFIFWKEEYNNLDGVIKEKQTFTVVPKSQLLPKAVNYDFLNE